MTSTVRLERSEPVARITLDRPDAANTLSRSLIDELHHTLDGVAADPTIAVVVLTGAGDRNFCAGADLKESMAMATGIEPMSFGPDVFTQLELLPQVTVAAINGNALGGGCELALACDFRIMVNTAQIGLPEITFGMLPAGGGTQRLSRIVGEARAKELVLLGRRIDGTTAEDFGLVTRAVDAATLDDAVDDLLTDLTRHAGYALRAGKMLLGAARNLDTTTGSALERRIIATMGSPEERRAAQEQAMSGHSTYRRLFTSDEGTTS